MPASDFITHTVANQPPELVFKPWCYDIPFQEAIKREGVSEDQVADIRSYEHLISGDLQEAGRLANENRPKLKLFDRYGHRLDEVEFHPAYHELMKQGIAHGASGYAWKHQTPGAHVARMGILYLHNQADQGTGCPITMTYACVPTVLKHPKWAKIILPRISSQSYDTRQIFIGEKTGITCGMGMTEKQGGSDVRTNTTQATYLGEDEFGSRYELIGHKWFFSAPMSDIFFVLAQTKDGIGCFLLPRILPNGERNAVRLQRLKDKIGDWSNASSEVEFLGAQAWLVGSEGRGISNILQMVALTRLDCMIGSASTMRRALVLALHHARHRKAFGKRLIEQPLMKNVLADLALDCEAHMALAARVARAIDQGSTNTLEGAFARIATGIGKYWICKRTPPFINEAQECHGGIGYVEESSIARLYRQAPLNSIWEGSGNVQCLDVLRALRREPETFEALRDELASTNGIHPAYDRQLTNLESLMRDTEMLEVQARYIVEQLALTLQASILLKSEQPWVGEAFVEGRIVNNGRAYGTLPLKVDAQRLIDRAHPEI